MQPRYDVDDLSDWATPFDGDDFRDDVPDLIMSWHVFYFLQFCIDGVWYWPDWIDMKIIGF